MNGLKQEKIKETLNATRKRRKRQIPRVYQLKLQNLSKKDRKKLDRLFLEAKWLYNYVVADIENRLTKDSWKLKEVEIKTPEGFEKRDINTLSSQMRQGIIERIKIQGIKKKFRVLGLHQIPENSEPANAQLVKKPSGYYLYLTCYLQKEKALEEIKKKQTRQPIGIDLGIKHQITLSNGEKISWYAEETKRLKKLQKTLSRKQKGSKNYFKTKLKIQKRVGIYSEQEERRPQQSHKPPEEILPDSNSKRLNKRLARRIFWKTGSKHGDRRNNCKAETPCDSYSRVLC
ncbi:transposase [Desulfurobacterium sp.]